MSTWKPLIQRGAGWFIRASNIHALMGDFFKNRSNIVHYHRIGAKHKKDYYLDEGATLERFRSDLTILKKRFEFVPLADMLRYNESQEHGTIKKPLISLTFDDGFDLHAAGASTVLAELAIPATTFVTSACIDNKHLMWQHKLNVIYHHRGLDTFVNEFNDFNESIGSPLKIASFAEKTAATLSWPMKRKDEYVDELWQRCKMPPIEEYLDEVRPYFTWQGLEAWLQAGNTVGLHTYSHPFCSKLDDQEIIEEIDNAAINLGQKLGISDQVLPFAYPFGDRLSLDKEIDLMARGHVSCLLGVQGLSFRGTPAHQLERACLDFGVDQRVFLRPLAQAARRQLRNMI